VYSNNSQLINQSIYKVQKIMVCCCNTIGNIFRLIVVGGCAFALVMQFLNVYSCDFISANASDDGLSTTNIGVWFQGIDSVCFEDHYEASEDSYVAWARSALILSMMCGAAAGILVLFEWIICEICCAGIVEGCAFVGAWGCGLGVYLIYGIDGCGTINEEVTGDNDIVNNISETVIPESILNIPTGSECTWGPGATYNLLACIAYFGCGVLLCFTPQPKPLCKQ